MHVSLLEFVVLENNSLDFVVNISAKSKIHYNGNEYADTYFTSSVKFLSMAWASFLTVWWNI